MLPLHIMIIMHHIPWNQQKVPFFQMIRPVIHQAGKLPLHHINHLIKVVMVNPRRSGRRSPLFINLIVLPNHILPLIFPAHVPRPYRPHIQSPSTNPYITKY